MSFKNATILFSVLALLLLFNSFFIVDEREKAIVLQFGETVREAVGALDFISKYLLFRK